MALSVYEGSPVQATCTFADPLGVVGDPDAGA